MLKILLVEDDDLTLHAMEAYFNQSNSWEVHIAENGVEALSKLSKESVDIVLTDYKMPEMDGLELRSRALELDPTVFVVILTGFSEKLRYLAPEGISIISKFEVELSEIPEVIQDLYQKQVNSGKAS